ncbi:hypothetical protein QE152_g16939 [Popillia japonica]|uniref:Uncharacterized protein n=1 Tax=Popillia japonica TaxID=7064 RepID=A0AAW1L5X7_POPJA
MNTERTSRKNHFLCGQNVYNLLASKLHPYEYEYRTHFEEKPFPLRSLPTYDSKTHKKKSIVQPTNRIKNKAYTYLVRRHGYCCALNIKIASAGIPYDSNKRLPAGSSATRSIATNE